MVEIERSMHKKPFLGGYRHKKTNIEFHHAACQTVQKPRPPANVERFCRDTQTSQQRNMVQQTTNNTSTQMTKIGVYVSNMTDKLIVPGKYTTADDYKSNILKQVSVAVNHATVSTENRPRIQPTFLHFYCISGCPDSEVLSTLVG